MLISAEGEGEEGKERADPSTLPFEQIKFGPKLGDLTLTAQVFKAAIGSKEYAVKLFKPFSEVSRDVSRLRLRRYKLSDDRFYSWRREVRVYEHIDKHIQGPKRNFFPKYYGATKLKRSLCPRVWRYGHDTAEDVPIIVLELLNGIEIHNEGCDLNISDLTRQTARGLYNDALDDEYVHIYMHCMEKIEALHDVKIVHSDLKPDVFMNGASVVCDFSISWSWDNDQPCLDAFKPRLGPRSFESRSEGERGWLQKMVTEEYKNNDLTRDPQLKNDIYRFYIHESHVEDKLRDRVPSWRDCSRCQQAMNDIISSTALEKRMERNKNLPEGIEEIDS